MLTKHRKWTAVAKVKALERIVKAMICAKEIVYRHRPCSMPQIEFRNVDVEEFLKVRGNVELDEMQTIIYLNIRKMSKELQEVYGNKTEAQADAVVWLFPNYWKENETLKEQVKELKKHRKDLNEHIDILTDRLNKQQRSLW